MLAYNSLLQKDLMMIANKQAPIKKSIITRTLIYIDIRTKKIIKKTPTADSLRHGQGYLARAKEAG